ncbi:Recombinase [Propionibacterium freudenreichii]|jgi:site-specific DNA recombinase|nr:Recombinase [Propionibacterium freudenreichii]CEI50559.1 Recombinase [Propionibacterium freudenreichii]
MTTESISHASAVSSIVGPPVAPTATAIIYLRVSTKEQAEKGGTDEGYSIPAQREANRRKAEQLGATVVEEFVDAGESARKADRPELMRMIRWVAQHRVNYCIVHKIDRLARNRADDVTIHLALTDAGVTLVSATENIDETPSGMLLHGIMSTIAEFYSRNLATETVKGLSQKAAGGGTVSRAPIGYRNIGVRDDHGREGRAVEVDPDRAPLVVWAFKVYASGEWSLKQLHRELVLRGLTTRPTPRRPARSIAQSSVQRMLTNPYYKGDVRYQGVTYRGAHEAIVPPEVWHQVQTVLQMHAAASDAPQIHDHYLKGTVYCGQCGSRLLAAYAKNRYGRVYPYFVCSGRQRHPEQCTRQAMLIERVEQLIEDYYQRIQVSPTVRQAVAGMLLSEFDRLMADQSEELARLTGERDRLHDEQAKLMQAHYADAVPLSLLKTEQDRIAATLDGIERRIEAHDGEYADARDHLRDSLNLLEHCAETYARCDDANRRLCNQAFFTAIYVEDDGEIRGEFARPFDALCDPELQADALTWAANAKNEVTENSTGAGPLVGSSHKEHLGWMTRLELATTWTTTRGSTS